MKYLNLKLTFTGPQKFKGKLTVQCSQPGTTKRHYMIVPGIEREGAENWSDDAQCYIGTD